MWRDVGVRRSADRMTQALEMIDRWCRYVLVRQFCDPHGWELQNMLTVARLMVRAALAREESRGVHLRTDFPADRQRALAAAPDAAAGTVSRSLALPSRSSPSGSSRAEPRRASSASRSRRGNPVCSRSPGCVRTG